MKKEILLVATVALAGVASVNAQDGFKPGAGRVSVEVGFSPFSETPVLGVVDAVEEATVIRGSYSVSDRLGVRLGLGFMNSFSNYDDKEGYTENTSNSAFSILPGVVYSFAGTDRLTPYVGLEFQFASTFNETVTDDNGIKVTVTNSGGNVFNAFGVALFTGFNYYVAKNLYLGVEVGLSYASTSFKNEEVTDFPADETEYGVGGFGLFATPALRLGWTF